MRPLERSLEKLDDVRRKKLAEMIGNSGGGVTTSTSSGLKNFPYSSSTIDFFFFFLYLFFSYNLLLFTYFVTTWQVQFKPRWETFRVMRCVYPCRRSSCLCFLFCKCFSSLLRDVLVHRVVAFPNPVLAPLAKHLWWVTS